MLCRVKQLAVVVLPGMDGTGDLLEGFTAAAPDGIDCCALPLPGEGSQSYARLLEHVLARLPASRFVLVAESFSGPLGVLVASRCERVIALVLCATFVRAPAPILAKLIPAWLWRRPPPHAVIRALMTGGAGALAAAASRVISRVDAAALAQRFAQVSVVDVETKLAELSVPVLYVRATRDRLIGRSAGEAVARARPDARVVEVDAPHLMLLANPSAVWKCIERFIAESVSARFSS